MATGHVPLWSSDKRNAYMDSVEQAHQRAIAEREGQFVARDIVQAWKKLSADGRQLLEYLLLLDAQSCVGQCEDDLLKQLVEKGFLQLPIGVRLVLLQDLETAFSVPPAVWSELKANRENWLGIEDCDRERRKRESAVRFESRIKPITTSGP